MSKVITEAKAKALMSSLYDIYCEQHGHPKHRLSEVKIGDVDFFDRLAFTYYYDNKCVVTISNEFIGTTHTGLLMDTIKLALVDIYCGFKWRDDVLWKHWAGKFNCKESLI